MTEHLCEKHDPSCYRCELNLDEMLDDGDPDMQVDCQRCNDVGCFSCRLDLFI